MSAGNTTDLRISECAALTLDDVELSSCKGLVIVQMGKGNTYRELPLNAEVRTALDAWLEQHTNVHRSSARNSRLLAIP